MKTMFFNAGYIRRYVAYGQHPVSIDAMPVSSNRIIELIFDFHLFYKLEIDIFKLFFLFFGR